jgi:hypothetical protein
MGAHVKQLPNTFTLDSAGDALTVFYAVYDRATDYMLQASYAGDPQIANMAFVIGCRLQRSLACMANADPTLVSGTFYLERVAELRENAEENLNKMGEPTIV